MSPPSLTDRLVRGVFQLWSSTYDWSPLQLVLYRPVHRAVMRAVEALPAAPRRALDLGCGTGRLTRDIARRHPRATTIGLDVSCGMLEAARRSPEARTLALVRGDAYALPFASGSLDLVTTTIAYHWLLEPAVALAEMRRVLVPGGRLVLGTLVSHLWSGRYLAMRVVTARQHEQDLAAAGFVVEARAPVGFRVVVFMARAGAAGA